ncbi:MAG: amidohydrolase family protein [Burkholderiaceae bacterium]
MAQGKNEPTFHQQPSQPGFAMPPFACDAHCHVFGPTAVFPYADNARFRPADAPKERLFALHDMLGIERCVIVQSGCHGYDNSVVADAIAARPQTYKGIALVPADISDQDLDHLAEQGFCGVRFNYMAHLDGGATLKQVAGLARRLERLHWHVQVHLESALLVDMAPALAAMPVPVVIDHMARIDASEPITQAPFEALVRLLEHEHIWIKVSGLERASRTEPPWLDAVPFAEQLVNAFPQRALWGTDWPHPNFRAAPPDDGAIVDMIPRFATTPELRQALLVDNPARFYGFN